MSDRSPGQPDSNNPMTSPLQVKIGYFSDILCIWAYIAQIRLDQLKKQFGGQVQIECHYLPVFGDTASKIANAWQERGGYQGYNAHIQQLAAQFDHIQIQPRLWLQDRPASSLGCHLFLKAVQLLSASNTTDFVCHEGRSLVEEAAWQCRLAFFRDGRNIALRSCLLDIARQLNLPLTALCDLMDNGAAFAALNNDIELKEHHLVQGSPTFLLNEGRQKLYGNVGYRIIEANIQELLEQPHDRASWC